MIRKFISAFMSAAMILVSAWPAFGATSAAIDFVDYNIDTNTVTVEGTAKAASNVSIMVLNPGKVLGDVGTDSDSIQNYATVSTDAKGRYTYSFSLHTDGSNDAGRYLVKVKPDGEAYISPDGEFFYADDSMNSEIINAFIISASVESLKTALENPTYRMALSLNSFAPAANISAESFAPYIYNRVKAISLDGVDTAEERRAVVSKLQMLLKEGYVLSLYNQSLSDKVFDSDGAFMYTDILGLDTLDADNGVTLYKEYKESVSAAGRQQIRTSLLGQNIADKTAWQSLFMKNTVLWGLKAPAVVGYAHVTGLLTAQNTAKVGLTLNGDISGEAAKIIAEATGYTTIPELQTVINNAIISAPQVNSNPQPTHPRGSNSGGSVSVNKPVAAAAFSDLTGYSWAEEAITALKKKGIVNGVTDNTYAPGDNVLREQFAKIIALAFSIEPGGVDSEFVDVSPQAWYATYVTGLCRDGIINGISETHFGSGSPITRADLCVMLHRVLKDKLTQKNSDTVFTDSAEIPEYAREAVLTMANAGIIGGYEDGSFRPHNLCTRAEMAKLVYVACQTAAIFQ